MADPMEGDGKKNKRRCTGTSKRSGKRCKNAPRQGQDVCGFHGGGSPQALAKATLRLEQEELARRAARSARRLLGGMIDVSPMQALLDAVRESAANVEAYREMVAELTGRGTGDDPVDGAPMWGPNHLGDAVPHIAVTLYNAERERLVKISQAALQAGATEAMVRVHQGIGAIVAGVMAAVIDDPRLGLDPDRRRLAKATAAERLIAIEAESQEAAA